MEKPERNKQTNALVMVCVSCYYNIMRCEKQLMQQKDYKH